MMCRTPYEASLAASLVAGLAVGATFAAAALIMAQAMGVPAVSGGAQVGRFWRGFRS